MQLIEAGWNLDAEEKTQKKKREKEIKGLQAYK